MSVSSTNSIAYAGTFQRIMDAKNRVTIPSGWLDQADHHFHSIVSPSHDCLIIMPSYEFESIEEKIRASGATPTQQRAAIRQFYGKAHNIGTDKSGRILLPEEQCQALQLKGEVALVGGRSRFEIWNSQRWEAIAQEEEASLSHVASLIGL